MKTILRQLTGLDSRELRRLDEAIWAEIQRRREAANVGLRVGTPGANETVATNQNVRPVSPLQARVANVSRTSMPRRAA